jgi:hypothetical protein
MPNLSQISSKKSLENLLVQVKDNLPKDTKKAPQDIPYKDDSVRFIETYLKILTKKKELVPLLLNAEQKHLLETRGQKNVILKPRQIGISTVIQADIFRCSITRPYSAVTLAHTGDSTQLLRRMSVRFWENMPDSYKPNRKYANAKLTSYTDHDSEVIIATAGSKQTGRGGTYSRIHGSEVAHWPDPESIIAGMIQGGDPEIDLESTPNGAQGYFYQKCREAMDGNTDWTFHFFAWYNFKEYRTSLLSPDEIMPTEEEWELIRKYNLTLEQIKWRRQKISDLKDLFFQEYPENPYSCFLLSGYGYFGQLNNVYIVPENTEPDRDHTYSAGLDFGQANDYTVLSIVDCTTKRQAAIYRWNKLQWKEIRRKVIDELFRWRVKNCKVETNNMGSTNIEAMKDEIKARIIEIERDDPKADIVHTRLQKFETNNTSKQHIMANLYEMLHSGEFKLQNNDILREEMTTFIATQLPSGLWRLAASGNAHDDTVMATAFSLDAMINDRRSGGIHV